MDQNGSLYYADNGNHVIRKIGPDGIISTIAGDGTNGYSGDNGLATNAKIGRPSSLYIRGNELFFHAWSTIGQGAVVDNKTYLEKISPTTGTYTCVITDANGNKVTTNPANLNISAPYLIHPISPLNRWPTKTPRLAATSPLM